MIYQIRANLYFSTLQIPDDIKHKLLLIWQHALVVNPGSADQECSSLEVIENHHDEHPHAPCTSIFFKDNCPE